MNKTKNVVLFEEDRDSMVDNWTDSLTVSRNARKRFTVELSKYGGDGDGGGTRRWRTWDKTVKLSTPMQVLDAIKSIAGDQSICLDWTKVAKSIAELDWITGAIIAVKKQVRLPALPTTDELIQQRSLRTLGKVSIGVEWGYEMHQLTLRLADWIDILNGESYCEQTTYYYEGERFVATWSFDISADSELEVTYGYDGGTGWRGELSSMDVLEGKPIDGVDLAKLLLKARRSDGQ